MVTRVQTWETHALCFKKCLNLGSSESFQDIWEKGFFCKGEASQKWALISISINGHWKWKKTSVDQRDKGNRPLSRTCYEGRRVDYQTSLFLTVSGCVSLQAWCSITCTFVNEGQFRCRPLPANWKFQHKRIWRFSEVSDILNSPCGRTAMFSQDSHSLPHPQNTVHLG